VYKGDGDTKDITKFEVYKGDGDTEDITDFEMSKGAVNNCSLVHIINGNTTSPEEDLFYREILFAAHTTWCWIEHVTALII